MRLTISVITMFAVGILASIAVAQDTRETTNTLQAVGHSRQAACSQARNLANLQSAMTGIMGKVINKNISSCDCIDQRVQGPRGKVGLWSCTVTVTITYIPQ